MFTIKESLIKTSKGRYDDNVASNREYHKEVECLK